MPSSFNNRPPKSQNNFSHNSPRMTNNTNAIIERLPASAHSSEDSSDSDTELLNNITRTREFPLRQRNIQRRLSLNSISAPKMATKAIDPFFQPKVLRKNNCITRAESTGQLVNESKKVLVIYTGGTIGMVKNDNGVYEPNVPHSLAKALKKYPQLHDDVYFKRNFPMPESKELLVLP